MKRELDILAKQVKDGNWEPEICSLWGGAGLIVTHKAPEGCEGKTIVVSQNAEEISAMVYRLKEIFAGHLDYMDKYDFYPQIGERAIKYIEENGDDLGVLEAMIDEAQQIASEFFVYYFAYGSNMDKAQMKKRCPNAIPAGIVRLDNYRFDLDSAGVATIKKDKSHNVEGVLWVIKDCDVDSLDSYEGVASGCYKREIVELATVTPLSHNGQNALVYVSLRGDNDGNRRSGYLESIIKAAEEWKLSDSYIAELKSHLLEPVG